MKKVLIVDDDDRHVVAAAIWAGAQAIVTFNVSDFPAAILGPLGLDVIVPDAFLLDHLDLAPATILQVVREQATQTTRPRFTPEELVGLLSRAGGPEFADEILRRMEPAVDGET